MNYELWGLFRRAGIGPNLLPGTAAVGSCIRRPICVLWSLSNGACVLCRGLHKEY
jgi:hypothetical protein